MPNVFPMRPLGEDEDSPEILGYVARDPIGVEDDAALPADWTSWNEGGEWTERVDGAFESEHDLYGLHHTLKVARGFALIRYNTTSGLYETHDSSYLQGSTGNILRGLTAFSPSIVAPGVVQVDLGVALPSVDGRISAFPSRGYIAKATPTANRYQAIRLYQVPNTSRLIVHVWVNDVLTNENFTIGIHDT